MALVPVAVYQIFDFTDCNAEHQKRHSGAKLSLINIVFQYGNLYLIDKLLLSKLILNPQFH